LKKLLTGNEAVAEGVIESGVEVVCGYPGTPSTEVILTLLPQKEELGIHIEWSTNEKVAFEIASPGHHENVRSECSCRFFSFCRL
jgi:indolepyruvate ferredoxin oxidoreductase alpha subunit